MKKYKVIADTHLEYGSHETIPKDKIVYEYQGCTYNCISPDGVAVTDKLGEIPFYEMPINSLREIMS